MRIATRSPTRSSPRLSGPDEYPPSLLVEGWAESQSRKDRDAQIRNLAKARREGWAYSLQELVQPAAYRQVSLPWSYWEGSPLVHYLMHRYGPATFLRLYAGVRPDTFHDDCPTILGDSWETVEEGFWKWIEAEDERLARADRKRAPASLHRVQLAKSVNPADWQTLVAGCREADKAFEAFPSNVALVAKGERIEKGPKASVSDNRSKWGFSAICEDRQFWIFGSGNCFLRSGNADWLLMSTPTCNAFLTRDDSGAVRDEAANESPRGPAVRLVTDCRTLGSTPSWLPIDENLQTQTLHIERLLRPTAATGKWTVWFTDRYMKDQPEVHHQIELDSACRWRKTRLVDEVAGQWRCETTWEYKDVGDGLPAVTMNRHGTDKDRETTTRCQLRPMSQAERRELKQYVEQTVEQWQPADPHRRLRRLMWTIVIGCPLGGVMLLVATRRRKPSPRQSIPPACPTAIEKPPIQS